MPSTNSPSSASSSEKILRLGARGSLLSRMQSEMVGRAIEAAHPGVRVELVIVTTSGDLIRDRPLHEFGGKGLFTKELELALLRGEIDFAVHSFKDVPVTMPLVDTAELVIAAVPGREDVRDVLVSEKGRTLLDLPAGASVGTGSLRRQAQVLALRPDLAILPIRGNVDTRVNKLKWWEFDAVILAMAGLKRAGLFDPAMMTAIETEQLLPAAGQGALALQCRRDGGDVRGILGTMNDPVAAMAVELERGVVKGLNGDCHSPIGVLAEFSGTQLRLRAAVGGRDGLPPVVRGEVSVERTEAASAPGRVVEKLVALGARELLGGN